MVGRVSSEYTLSTKNSGLLYQEEQKDEVRYPGYLGRGGETTLVLKSKGLLILKFTSYLTGSKGEL